jgi:hypothetical protein
VQRLLRIAVVCLSASAFAPAGDARAHPIVSTDINRHVGLRVTDDRLQIRYIYELLEIAAINTARAWDADGDGTPSARERDAYAAYLSEELRHAIQLRLDGAELPLQLDGVRWELGEGAMGLSTWKLYVRLSSGLPMRAPTAVLEYRDTLRPAEVGWKEIVLTAGGSTLIARADVPAQDLSHELTDYAAIADSPNPDRTTASAVLRFAAAETSPAPTAAAAMPSASQSAASSQGEQARGAGARGRPVRRGLPASPSAEMPAPSAPEAAALGEAAAAGPAGRSTPAPLGASQSGGHPQAEPPRGMPSPTPSVAAPAPQHVDAGAPSPTGSEQAPPVQQARASASFASAWHHYAWPFFKLGVHHIATGYDHLLFLLGLLLLRQGFGRLVGVVTAFTVAHSITLGVAAAGLVRPPGAWIELAIAASIAYVGFAALLRPRTSHGPWIALAFGLVHGFGFAAALSVALEGVTVGRGWLVALASFNLGIEAFQLLVVALLWPLLQGADRLSWASALRKALALGVSAAGVAWMAARV